MIANLSAVTAMNLENKTGGVMSLILLFCKLSSKTYHPPTNT